MCYVNLVSTSKVMVIYQYMSSSSYHKIHLIKLFFSYCIFIYNKYLIYYISLLFITRLYLSHKCWINLFLIFSNTMFCCRQVHSWPPKIFITNTKKFIQRRVSIRSRPICCEGDFYSDLNRLASVMLRKYTTVTDQF